MAASTGMTQQLASGACRRGHGPGVSLPHGIRICVRPACAVRLGKPADDLRTRLFDRLRANVGAKRPSALQEIEVIFTALFLAEQGASQSMDADTRRAFNQLWALQLQSGASKGAWRWYQANLDPWENPDSSFYGASLAALALGTTGANYREEAPVAERTVLSLVLQSTLLQGRSFTSLAELWAFLQGSEPLPDAARGRLR